MTTTFQRGVRVKKLNSDITPSVRVEPDLQGAGTIGGSVLATAGGTALVTADGFFLMTVITTAGTTVAGKVPFFTV